MGAKCEFCECSNRHRSECPVEIGTDEARQDWIAGAERYHNGPRMSEIDRIVSVRCGEISEAFALGYSIADAAAFDFMADGGFENIVADAHRRFQEDTRL